MRTAAKDHLQLPAADLFRQIPHQKSDVPVTGPGEADVAIVALVRVEAEVPKSGLACRRLLLQAAGVLSVLLRWRVRGLVASSFSTSRVRVSAWVWIRSIRRVDRTAFDLPGKFFPPVYSTGFRKHTNFPGGIRGPGL